MPYRGERPATAHDDDLGLAGRDNSVESATAPFHVVGVGASAGGLNAFKALLDALPADTGMAFVLVQHLDPDHESLMAELLISRAAMPVREAAEGDVIEPNHVYLNPPAMSPSVRDGVLHLSKPLKRHGARMAIDFFLVSLAEEYGDRAMAVVLSGRGSDGSEGLKAVKANHGFVVVQDPDEASSDGMPTSAIATGLADLIMPIAQIPKALIHRAQAKAPKPAGMKSSSNDMDGTLLSQILAVLQTGSRRDFGLYKTGTLERRAQRRMGIVGVTDYGRYIQKLRHDPAEAEALADDLLIHVTQFFRDAPAFQTLETTVIHELVEAVPMGEPLRLWVAGCSTGEEVYSLTILFLEAIAASGRCVKLQVFATDVDAQAVAFARAGVYARGIEAHVDRKHLARFFLLEGDKYRVNRDVRDAIVFTVQDLLGDPPFSRLDFISCRNVLIYLQARAQTQILSLFHFALRPQGILFLGQSETVSQSADFFETVDKKQRIYRNTSPRRTAAIGFPWRKKADDAMAKPSILAAAKRKEPGAIAQKLLLDIYAPASALIDLQGESVFYSGDIARYIEVSSGNVTSAILAMLKESLRPAFLGAEHEARQTHAAASRTVNRFESADGAIQSVTITVRPVPDAGLLLVSFVDEAAHPQPAVAETSSPEDAGHVLRLEQELELTRNDLHGAISELEIADEDHRAVNEEALSINEEFQSTNEELETSKEELQALNEELTALNTQLHETLQQQRSTSADLENILDSSDVATLFLDAALNIRFFTPAAKSLFGITTSDVGRPLADFAKRFDDDALISDAKAVLADRKGARREIRGHDGQWYIRGVLPYRDKSRTVSGVVVTFSDVTELKAAERKIGAAKAYAEGIVASVKQPLVVLDQDLRIVSASASFFTMFEVPQDDATGRPVFLGRGPPSSEIASFLHAVQENVDAEQKLEISVDLPKKGRKTFRVSAHRLPLGVSGGRTVLVAFNDVTDANAKACEIALAKDEAERANLAKSRFLAAASHDLRQPLQTMSLLQGMLQEGVAPTGLLLERLNGAIATMSRLLDKILDINQLEAGVVQPHTSDFSIGELLSHLQAEFERVAANDALLLRVAPCDLVVRSDPRLVEQILRNLLSNAVKYTNTGKILIGCRRSGGRVRVEVWDTGLGIPQSELNAIFQEFHQIGSSAPKRTKGLGLGLSIVQRLCELLHVPIAVRSKLGHGSVFSIELPVVRRATALSTASAIVDAAADEIVPGQLRMPGVLVVEDDAEVRDALTLLFSDKGYRAFAARDGAEALALASQPDMGLDIIIADYNLPGSNGVEVVAEIANATNGKVHGVILTGDISTATLREIKTNSLVHFHKPVNGQTLIAHISQVLRIDRGDRPQVFLVDDDLDLQGAMRDALTSRGHSVAAFADGEAFLRAYRPSQSGCLIVDVRMPGMDGIALLKHLKDMQAPLSIIVMTAFGDIATSVAALRLGAFDFLQKPVGQIELLSCIERALHRPASRSHNRDTHVAVEKLDSLTSRQRAVLDGVLAGQSSKTIAFDLNISQRTVENHRIAIMKKVGATSLAGLIRIAVAAIPDAVTP